MKCGKCGRELVGLNANYAWVWDCSDCAIDKKDVLHCENNCKVVVKTLNAGSTYDKCLARKLLSIGSIYSVKAVSVGGWMSYVELNEFPNKVFNTVFFERFC